MKKHLITCLVTMQVLTGLAQEITYNKDIAPILRSKCATCHKPGDAAPFPLLTYEDASKRATFIRKVVQSGYMPPWHADRQYSHFANERGLTSAEIALISKWVDDKAPQGKASTPASTPSSAIRAAVLLRSCRKPDTRRACDTGIFW